MTPSPTSSPAAGARPARPAARQGTEEYHSAPLPTAQEAAVLYSANHLPAAVALLKHEIKDPLGRNNKQAWLMLFELHQLTPNREEYDSLSMLFTVKFEQSPPAWSESGDAGGDPRRSQSRERKDFFALKPTADGDLAGEIDKFVAFADSQGTVRLDVGKIGMVGPGEATLLTAALVRLRRKKMPMWFNNVEGLEKGLRSAFNERATDDQRPFWLLLFELLILQDKNAEFEDLGLEYAVAFEMSPPNWEVYVNSVAAAVAKTPAAAKPAAARDADVGFPLKGVISGASANQIAELNGYAANLSEVAIDTGKVLRIDFAFASAFFDVVKGIQLAGKRVILSNLNELNAGLLEAFGFNRYAILVRKKSI